MSDELQTVDDVLGKIRETHSRNDEEILAIIGFVSFVILEIFAPDIWFVDVTKFTLLFASGFMTGAAVLAFGIVEDLDAVGPRGPS